MRLNGLFVTGTDTDVGKTCVATALLHRLAGLGWRAAGYKPVAAGAQRDGTTGALVNSDVRQLRLASSVALSDEEVGPCVFETACAPHLAAQLERRRIERATLLDGARHLAARADVLVVEGAGGFCVPLGGSEAGDFDSADLAVDLGLPVVLVVGLRLGCLNHALLTAEAVQRRGLHLAGWVGNAIEPHWPYREANLETLRARLGGRHGCPCLGELPWLAQPDAAALAVYLDSAVLQQALTVRPATTPAARQPALDRTPT